MSQLGYGGYPPRPPGTYTIVRGTLDASILPPPLKAMFDEFEANLADPYRGLSSDGNVDPSLFHLDDIGTASTALVDAAQQYLDRLGKSERAAGHLAVDANEWRAWINAFSPKQPHGLLLDDVGQDTRDAAMAVLAAGMSERGFAEVRKMMVTNGALGVIAPGYEDTLREWMYWFSIFGTPSADGPWGFQLFGHHACVNVFVVGRHITISPIFLGAEPRVVEDGDHAGTRSFDSELALGHALIWSLRPDQLDKAVISKSIQWADLPPELAHPTEGRMRGSQARDNAVVPLDGISARDLDAEQREHLDALLAHYTGRLPAEQAEEKMAQIRAHLDDTYFAWAGSTEDNNPFYYKIQSPVTFIELDSHSGIFLSNDDPEMFHIHNIIRTPNGNDYGRAHLAQVHRQSKVADGS